jgi:hypothetical protein
LKATLATTAFSSVPFLFETSSPRKTLPTIPGVDDLAGGRFTHRMRDLYSNQTTQNELGYAQGAKSLAGITAIGIPHLRLLRSSRDPVESGFPSDLRDFPQRPHLALVSGWRQSHLPMVPAPHHPGNHLRRIAVTTEMFMPSKRQAVAQVIRLKNLKSGSRKITLGFDLRTAVSKKPGPTNSPREADNQIEFDSPRGCLIFEARHSQAVSVQGLDLKPTRVSGGRMLIIDLSLGPGEMKEFHYVNAIDQDRPTALAAYDSLQSNFSKIARDREQSFNSLITSARQFACYRFRSERASEESALPGQELQRICERGCPRDLSARPATWSFRNESTCHRLRRDPCNARRH